MLGVGALCIVLLLSGCGGDGNATSPDTPITTDPSTNPGGGTTPAVCATSQCAPAP